MSEAGMRGEDADARGVRGRRVVVAGAASESGVAVCAALVAAGATVVGVGSNGGRLDALAERVPGALTEVCDLSDSAAVDALAQRLTSTGPVDGLVHLVGGWVGGRGITGQTDDGWAAMERAFRTLRNTTRSFYPALVASEAGRVAFVSSTAVDRPTASGADYAAGKAASESWLRSVAAGFAADQPALRSAVAIFVVLALVDDRMRAAAPEKTFAGHTEVSALAASVAGLWDEPASALNGRRIRL
ncbi:SDR family oxidoreductase [Herbiconiux sp. 11R-BC]|uniref:SDR family NAD(P)-dependent oxidoreductase n=1 Tax=Herbiconiux sp. 11R-BC TaxID=3111637 RepID=UPI003C05892D